uniref:Uncharacterized protein n=1 Tax=Amphimedon queenslandica TaxID=400682 RepID=A0A1X7TTB3_AMPQE
MYGKVEALLLKAATSQPYEEELKHRFSLKHFKPISSDKRTTVSDILTFQSSSPGQVQLMHQVAKLMRLLLVMPTTNSHSQRSFRAVRCIKTYLRSSMSQKRLYHLMLLHIHKSDTDELDLIYVANNFISNHEHRKNFFSIEFKQSDLNQ